MFLKEKKNSIKCILKLKINACKASILPPIGPILGQYGFNIVDFCEKFNNDTKYLKENVLLIVYIYILKNFKYIYYIKLPNLYFLIFKNINNKLIENLFKFYIGIIYLKQLKE